ncbi:MAG: PA0069 family radical SAM protein [Roseovarius sp.]
MSGSTVDPNQRTLARGACSNRGSRYDMHHQNYEDDGWSQPEDAPVLRTSVHLEEARRIISYNCSPDLPFDRSINPYRGCEHGCIYCFARPTHAWLGLSPGLDFETRLIARPNAPECLERELRAARYRVAPIAIGTNTDPYQPIEQEHEIMRKCLQVLHRCRHPVAIVTKGTLIERDLDILAPMAAEGLVRVGVSVTTLDPVLARRMEPRVPTPQRRLATIRALSDAGIAVRIMASPMIPGLSDHELEAIVSAGAEAGAVAATYIMLRLPLEVSELFQEWLSQHYPDRAARVMGHLRDMHGGKAYSSDWGKRMKGAGQYADIIGKRYRLITRRLGLNTDLPALRCDLFQPPQRTGDQLTLFS